MYRTQSLYLKLLQTDPAWNLKDVLSIISSNYDEKKGFGFIPVDTEGLLVEATLIYETNIFRNVFDPGTGTFTAQPQIIFHQAPFRLDFESGLLQAQVGGKRLNRLLTTLSWVFRPHITIKDLFFDVSNLLPELNKRGLVYRIVRVTIANYRPHVGLIGRFKATISEQRIVAELISTYSTDITEIVVEIYGDDDVVTTWGLSTSGKVIIRTEEDLLDTQTILATDVMLRCRIG